MKILDKSVLIARSLFPNLYSQKQKYRTFHFSFAWKRNKLLSIGINDPDKVSHKALKFARLFNNSRQIKYPYLHAEIDMISKLWGKCDLGSIKVVVIRLNRSGDLQNSKPCANCSAVLNALGVENIWWSNSTGDLVNA